MQDDGFADHLHFMVERSVLFVKNTSYMNNLYNGTVLAIIRLKKLWRIK